MYANCMKKKILFTIVASVLLLALYMLIFGFSAQDGEASGSISLSLSRLGVEFVNGITGSGWTENFIMERAAYLEHPLRKLAHFGEYAVMGILVHGILLCWRDRKLKWCTVTVLWVVISATADEFHQYFVPGRCCSIMDVILDTCGGITGMIICHSLFLLYLHKKNKK